MQNRNILWFTLGTLILLGAQWFVTRRYAPVTEPVSNSAPMESPATTSRPTSTTAASEPVAKSTRPASPGSTITVNTQDLDVSFRKDTGALIQVKWLRDGTLFFPQQTTPGTGNFIGLGEFSKPFTDHRSETTPTGINLDFFNNEGDHLIWTVGLG